MTLSPPSFDENSISTRMNGSVLMTLQLSIGPPIGVIALSTSAAVVPFAKFCAMTQKGPAMPRMEKLGAAAAGLLTMLTCWAASAEESMRERAEESLFWRREADFLEAGLVMREERRLGEETEAWRS